MFCVQQTFMFDRRFEDRSIFFACDRCGRLDRVKVFSYRHIQHLLAGVVDILGHLRTLGVALPRTVFAKADLVASGVSSSEELVFAFSPTNSSVDGLRAVDIHV